MVVYCRKIVSQTCNGWLFTTEKLTLTAECYLLEGQQIEDVLIQPHLVLLSLVRHVQEVHDVGGGLAGVGTHALVVRHLVGRTLPRAPDALELARHSPATAPAGNTVRQACMHSGQRACSGETERKKVSTHRGSYIRDRGPPSLKPSAHPAAREGRRYD